VPKSKRPKSGSSRSEPPTLPLDFLKEREQMMSAIGRMLEEKKLATHEDANAFLATLAGKKMNEIIAETGPPTPCEQAQELAWQAMDAETAVQARALAQRALALDPDCVDALVVMTDLDAKSDKEAIAGLEGAVAAGERALGADFFRENKGHFWGIMETRPYMRARLELAELRRHLGHYAEAAKHYEQMLELNPNDNQGVRDLLLACYLAQQNKVEAAASLLKRYEDDCGAVFAWGRVLQRFLEGDRPGATRALKIARRENRFVERYLTCTKRLPEDTPETYQLGSEDEAVICCSILMPAWAKHRAAMFWLFDRLQGGAQ
jgi:tetratricopeptide (TPR) repeat protein